MSTQTSTEQADQWLRVFHPRPSAEAKLVCFPHAGGSATAYHAMSAALPPSVQLVAVQYPGRQDRRAEPFAGDVAALASGVAGALAGEPGSVALFGHSMGAVVAFETARLLERDGADLLRLFVSGRGAPALGTFDKDLDAWDDDRIITELIGLGGTGQAQLAETEVIEMMMPPLRADYRALRSYRCDAEASVRCPVTALTGDADSTTPVEHAAAWDQHTMSDFDLHTYQGGHFFVAEHQDAVVSLLSEHVQEDVAWTRSFL